MQEFTVDTRTFCDEQGQAHTFRYVLLAQTVQAGHFSCEDFGVKIEEVGGGSAAVERITPSHTRIRQLLALLIEHGATPTNLADVVQDWL